MTVEEIESDKCFGSSHQRVRREARDGRSGKFYVYSCKFLVSLGFKIYLVVLSSI